MVQIEISRRASLLAAPSNRLMRAAASAASPEQRARTQAMRQLIETVVREAPSGPGLHLRRGAIDAHALKAGEVIPLPIKRL